MGKFVISAAMDDAGVVKATASIERRSTSVRNDVVATSKAIVLNWAKSGDVGTAALRATELMDAVDASHKQKIVNWFGKHAGFMLVKTEQGKALGYDADKTKITTAEFQEIMKAKDVYEETKDAATTPYILRDKLESLIKAAENKRKKGVTDKDDIPADMITALKALV